MDHRQKEKRLICVFLFVYLGAVLCPICGPVSKLGAQSIPKYYIWHKAARLESVDIALFPRRCMPMLHMEQTGCKVLFIMHSNI